MNSLLDIKTEMQVEKEVPIPRSDPTDGDIIPQKSYPAYCTLCKVSAFPVTGHLNGNRHRENLKSQGKKAGNSSKFTISSKFVITDPTQNPNYIHCVLCEVFCGNQKTWDSHFNGKRHKQNTALFFCEWCNVRSRNQNDLDKHLAGEKHQSKAYTKKKNLSNKGGLISESFSL